MRRITSAIAASIATVTALAGCPSREVAKVPVEQQKQDKKTIPVVAERDIDILFLIDDSDSMGEEQQSLAENFPRFIEKLTGIQGGLPNVHIGIISSNVGAHPDIPTCTDADSDEGRLQFAFVNQDDPRCQDGSLGLDGKFIRDVVINDETGARERNYTGPGEDAQDLSDVFSCMAKLGVGGCGFEGQLESIKQALSNPDNEGFLRPNAYLAIIIITDEDDCSAFDPEMFNPRISGKESALGPLDSFRCFEFGVQCEPDDPRELGEKTNCVPRTDSPYMPDVQDYVQFVKDLKKDDPSKIIVAGIIGVDDLAADKPLEVELVQKERAEVFSLVPACQVLAPDGVTVESKATPAVRLRAFLEQFPGRNTIQTICQRDLSGALDLIGDLLAAVLKNPFCLTTDVIDVAAFGEERPYDCQVSDVRDTTGEETVLSHCNDDASNTPCWYLRENQDGCELAPFQELVVERGSTSPPSDTNVIVNCAIPTGAPESAAEM
jgi:hypothetical protein